MTAERTLDLVEAERVIRGILIPLVGDPDDLDDVTQLCLIKTWKNWATFEGRSRWTSWLYRVTHNEFITWTRRREYWRRCDESETRHRVAEDPGEKVISRLLVRQLLKDLGHRQHELIELLAFQGLTSAEAGTCFGVASSTIRCWKRDLRKELKGQW